MARLIVANQTKALAVLRLCALLILPSTTLGGPWVEAGDARLRSDLELLGDAGIVTAPLTAWPLSWGDIGKDLNHPPDSQDPVLRAALHRVQTAFTHASRSDAVTPHIRIALSDRPRELRTFNTTPREQDEAEIGAEWTGERFAYRAQMTTVNNLDDGQYLRPDGSYAGMALGNWMLSAGWLDRWWGPGWEGSLIWSNNPRPIPAFTLQRNDSAPFDWPVLRWLGPWQFTATMGRLDDHTTVPHTQFFGARLNFKPLHNLEVGLSRTAQWGGQGRPEHLSTFYDMLIGRDNVGGGLTAAKEPGNQLAGFDMRWVSPLFNLPYAIYVQAIGEDFCGTWPCKYTALMGAETWGVLPGERSYRLHAEYANTLVNDITGSTPMYDTAYTHHIYTSGYTYRGSIIGHAMGGDGRMISLGALVVDRQGRTWEALLRRTETDRDPPTGDAAHTELAAEGGYVWSIGDNNLDLRLALTHGRDNASGAGNTETHIGLQWSREF